jgi:hypothetical protein
MSEPVVQDMILNTLSKSLLEAIQVKGVTIEQLMEARLEIEMVVLRHVLAIG